MAEAKFFSGIDVSKKWLGGTSLYGFFQIRHD
jgi:hypothetical protein